jgi:hypothetical protein
MMPPKISVSSSFAKNSRATARAKKGRPLRLDRLAHEMANQLTIMNLGCFKIRAAVRSLGDPIVADIARIEKAVAEMTSLIEAWPHVGERNSAAKQAPVILRPKRSAKSSNVYALFSSPQTL